MGRLSTTVVYPVEIVTPSLRITAGLLGRARVAALIHPVGCASRAHPRTAKSIASSRYEPGDAAGTESRGSAGRTPRIPSQSQDSKPIRG
jgi:hypothetical protein